MSVFGSVYLNNRNIFGITVTNFWDSLKVIPQTSLILKGWGVVVSLVVVVVDVCSEKMSRTDKNEFRVNEGLKYAYAKIK